MLILILIDVQYSQKAVFSFEGLNFQNHSISGNHYPVKKSSKISNPPHPLTLFGKPYLPV